MYTVLWTRNDVDGWDRFNSKEEVEEKVRELIEEGFSNEDMMVFNPYIDYIVPEEDGTI